MERKPFLRQARVMRPRMRYHPSFRGRMGRSTFTIVLSLAGAGAAGFCVFVLLEAVLPFAHPSDRGATLFRFQLSSMMAMAVFAGVAIVLYVRLSRSSRSHEPERAGHSRPRKK